MLSKALKHEFRSTARIMLPILGAILLLGVMCGVSSRIIGEGVSLYWLVRLVLRLLEVAFVLGLFAVCIVAVVIMVQRFYHSLLGTEGYLSWTLPMTVDGHIWTKLLTAAVWLIAAVCFCAAGVSVASAISSSYYAPDFQRLFDFIGRANESLGVGNTVLFALEGFVLCALVCFAFCLHFYSAMAVGGSFAGHKKLLSAVAYFVIGLVRDALAWLAGWSVVKTCVMLLEKWDWNNDAFNEVRTGHLIFGSLLFAALLLCAFYYLITRLFLKEKLNLA